MANEIPAQQELQALAAALARGQYEAALGLAQTLSRRYPRHPFAWKALGALLGQAGRSREALLPLQQAVALAPTDAAAHNNLGSVLRDLKSLPAAQREFEAALHLKPDYVEAYGNLANTLHDLGEFDAAEVCYKKALVLRPDFAELISNFGANAIKLGRYDAALSFLARALALMPKFPEAHCNVGNARRELGKLHEAEESFRQALCLDQNYAVAHNNLGAILRLQGRLKEAAQSYRNALCLKPDYAEAWRNLAMTQWANGRLSLAETSCRRALRLKEDYLEALDALASLLIAQGRAAQALPEIQRSLRLKETTSSRWLFVDAVRRLTFTRHDPEIEHLLVRALTEPWDRPGELARAAIEFIKLTPVGKLMASAGSAASLPPSGDLAGGVSVCAATPLLAALLQSAPICDIDMERFLTQMRAALLFHGSGAGDEAAAQLLVEFTAGLAHQCFINEYVFAAADDELAQATRLKDEIATALATDAPIAAFDLLRLATYFPLSTLPGAERLLARPYSKATQAVLQSQIAEPAEEMALRQTIPLLTAIASEVSRTVRCQYEENPYPRWLRTARKWQTQSLLAYLRQEFPLAPLPADAPSPRRWEVLVAGCGTGQQAIETAQQFGDANVLAVNLSLTSLAFAARKSSQLAVDSVQYAQADLLELGKIERRFDFIACSGVLHHLAEPLAGWRVLVSLLNDGGFMQIGLYSELARRKLAGVRDWLARHGYTAAADDIRRARPALIANEDFRFISTWSDFYTVSSCRDLLFHVQEQVIGLDEIKALLAELDLTFLGFQIGGETLHAYRRRFPQDPAAIDLDCWQQFENEHPDTFRGMYQFWLQKARR